MENKKGKEIWIKSDYKMRNVYREYLKETKNPLNLTQTQFSAIFRDYIDMRIKGIVLNNEPFKLPFGLGTVSVKKFKLKPKFTKKGLIRQESLVMNWGETNKLWKKQPELKSKGKAIYQLNKHTDGYIMKFYWDKKRSRVKNLSAYTFKVVREYKIFLSNVLKDENMQVDFFEFKSTKSSIT